MAPLWRFAAGPWDGVPVSGLYTAKGRSLTFDRSDGATFECTVDGRGPDAPNIEDLVTDVHAWRGTEKLFRGRVALSGDELDVNTHTTKVSAGDYRNVLDRRFVYEGDPYIDVETTADVATVVADLVNLTQARTAGDLGIVLGHGFPLAGRTVTALKLSAGTSIRQAIDVMAEADRTVTGFDWEITPALILNIFAGGRGTNLGATLKYGDNVDKVGRTNNPGAYANVLRGNGSTNAGIAQTVEVDDLLDRPEGRWEAQVGFPDVNTFDVLVPSIVRELKLREVTRASYTVELTPGWWQGPQHVWLGDVVRFVVLSGRLAIDEDLAVEKIIVTPTEDGEERVSMEIVSEFPGFLRRMANLEDRVARLERN